LAVWALWPTTGVCSPIGYSITITTAYANGNPFANQIDNTVWSEPDTGYIQIVNTGETTFSGVVGTIAVSAFAGDLSVVSNAMVLAPGAEVSIGMWFNSAAVGGFNGPYYTYQPGAEIYLDGSVSDTTGSEAVNLLVADRDIHSGVTQTDPFGLASDSFVLQGGDPWGLDNSDGPYALSQADGTYVFGQTVPEPWSAACLAAGLAMLLAVRRRFRSRPE
jgi:hypothetical protein